MLIKARIIYDQLIIILKLTFAYLRLLFNLSLLEL
jgi:hypothetical protein